MSYKQERSLSGIVIPNLKSFAAYIKGKGSGVWGLGCREETANLQPITDFLHLKYQ